MIDFTSTRLYMLYFREQRCNPGF